MDGLVIIFGSKFEKNFKLLQIDRGGRPRPGPRDQREDASACGLAPWRQAAKFTGRPMGFLAARPYFRLTSGGALRRPQRRQEREHLAHAVRIPCGAGRLLQLGWRAQALAGELGLGNVGLGGSLEHAIKDLVVGDAHG